MTSVRIGSNGPFWSLGFEVWYYVLFGVAIFMRGWRRWMMLGIGALLVGPGIVLLSPVWAVGVGLHWVLARDIRVNSQRVYPLISSVVLTVAPVIIYLICRETNLEDQLRTMMMNSIGAKTVNELRYAGDFVWWWILALMIAAHLAGMFTLIKRVPDQFFERIGAPVRWLAMASFSIYLIHYPVLQFLDAVIPVRPDGDFMRAATLFIATAAIIFVFAELFERRLDIFRATMRRLMPGMIVRPTVAPSR